MVRSLELCASTLMSAGYWSKIQGILKWTACGLGWKNIFSAVDSVLSRIIKEKSVVNFHGFFPNEYVWQSNSLFVNVMLV